MVGYRVNYYWFVCWVFLAPAFMVVSFFWIPFLFADTKCLLFQFLFAFYFVKYVPISMGDYKYPAWGEALGFMISLSSMLWVPGNIKPITSLQIFLMQIVGNRQIQNLDDILQAMPSTSSSQHEAHGRRC